MQQRYYYFSGPEQSCSAISSNCALAYMVSQRRSGELVFCLFHFHDLLWCTWIKLVHIIASWRCSIRFQRQLRNSDIITNKCSCFFSFHIYKKLSLQCSIKIPLILNMISSRYSRMELIKVMQMQMGSIVNKGINICLLSMSISVSKLCDFMDFSLLGSLSWFSLSQSSLGGGHNLPRLLFLTQVQTMFILLQSRLLSSDHQSP